MSSSAFDLSNPQYSIDSNGRITSQNQQILESYGYVDPFRWIGDKVSNLWDSLFPSVSSAKQIQAIQNFGQMSGLTDAVQPILNFAERINNGSSSVSFDSGSSGVGFSGAGSSGFGSSVSPEYINAALAQHYGMSSATAYQEALSNTAYQRAVADMQRAGLNPAVLFGAGRASSAQGVSYIAQNSGSSGGSSDDGFVFSPGMYNFISVIAGLAAATLTKKPYAYIAGQTAAKSIMTLMSER